MSESPIYAAGSNTATEPHVSVHRWPWTNEEFLTMGIVFVAFISGGYLSHNIWWLTGAVVAAFASMFWLYRVKKTRTDRSQVTITITGDRVTSQSRGTMGHSGVNLSEVSTFGYRKFGSDETFMLSDEDAGARIPFRATTDPVVNRVVKTAFANAESFSEEARDLYQKMLDRDAIPAEDK